MKKILSITMIFIVFFSTFSLFIIDSGSETINKYRRVIIVDNTRNPDTLSNYQVFINVTYDSAMQPDFDDLRFTWYNETSGQEANIDYWLDKYVGSEYALIWVEIPSIRGLGREVLYMYYGDPDAISGSNGEETFIFFDDFSTDTTPNYEVYRGNGEINWNPNGWLFLNASIRESLGRNSNVHVRHKTALIDATEEKYWLETKAKAFGTGVLDYFGVKQIYKYDSVPKWYYSLSSLIRHVPQIASIWGGVEAWEFWKTGFGTVPTGKDIWYRFGVGTSLTGTVYGKFYNDDYNELETLVEQTIHQNNEWWIGLTGSRSVTEPGLVPEATLCVYFDYVRVRKFTDPEPSYSIGPEEPLPAIVDIDPDTLNLKSNGQWITAYITLPGGYNVEDIVFETVELDGVSAAWSEIQEGVYMAKFDRALVRVLSTGMPDYEAGEKFLDLPLIVTGELVDGTPFEGSDTVVVIHD